MRKFTVFFTLLVALVFGFSSTSFAQHCEVQKGDSIWKIAKRYNVSFAEVLVLNKHLKNPHLIFPKDKIEIPDEDTGTSTNQHSESDKIQSGDHQASESATSQQAKEVLRLVNQERSKQGLKSLQLSSNLTSIATTKSKDMAINNYFSHTSPTYGSPFEMLQHFGVSYRSAGENIAAGQKTAQEVMNAWMNSSGHRANILNSSYTELGVGYYKGGSYGHYWTQEFIGK